MTLADLMNEAITMAPGNQEFALFYNGTQPYVVDRPNEHWCAQLGNTSKYVSLGESTPEFYGEGATAEAAVLALIAKLKEPQL
jgi:hypothetical protein